MGRRVETDSGSGPVGVGGGAAIVGFRALNGICRWGSSRDDCGLMAVRNGSRGGTVSDVLGVVERRRARMGRRNGGGRLALWKEESRRTRFRLRVIIL
jgi:hypothetical protein